MAKLPRALFGGVSVWVLASLYLAGMAQAAGPDRGGVADMRVSKGGLVWRPHADHDGLVLTVVGPETSLRLEFPAGSKASLDLTDKAGQALPDGFYKYELRAAPKLNQAEREKLARIRQSGDTDAGREMARSLKGRGGVQSGSFTVVEGSVVDEGAAEPSSARQKTSAITGDLEVAGDLRVAGIKSFVAQHPDQAGITIHYVALEGPEAGTYFRGTAATGPGGLAVIDLPGHFARLTEPDGLTVQLTPVEGWSRLYIAQRSPDGLTIRDADGREGIVFDFLVQGVRRGYGDFEVERRIVPAEQEEAGKGSNR